MWVHIVTQSFIIFTIKQKKNIKTGSFSAESALTLSNSGFVFTESRQSLAEIRLQVSDLPTNASATGISVQKKETEIVGDHAPASDVDPSAPIDDSDSAEHDATNVKKKTKGIFREGPSCTFN